MLGLRLDAVRPLCSDATADGLAETVEVDFALNPDVFEKLPIVRDRHDGAAIAEEDLGPTRHFFEGDRLLRRSLWTQKRAPVISSKH